MIDTADGLVAYSWTIISEHIAVKSLDRSAFIHGGSGIPVAIRHFFWLIAPEPGLRCNIVLIHSGKEYKGSLASTAEHSHRTRIFWDGDFARVLATTFPRHHEAYRNTTVLEQTAMMVFTKAGNDHYAIELPEAVDSRVLTASMEDSPVDYLGVEGQADYYPTRRYERDPISRALAIAYHGLSCRVCGFNFEAKYGELGMGFIEVHHVHPLSEQHGEPTIINPRTDLIPVCSNCHRMLHRTGNLAVEQLRSRVKDYLIP